MKYEHYKVNKSKGPDIKNWPQLCISDIQPVKKEVMNDQQIIEDRLWDYIDGRSESGEKTAIEQLIEENIAWRKKYHELLEVHQLMLSSELEAPSMRFTKNVMEEISKFHVAPATKTYINKRVIWGIGFFFLALITGFLIYGFSQVNWSSGTGSSEIMDQYNRIPKPDWSRFLNNTYTNIFMMINVVLGLILVDMYLHRKKVKTME
jgi:hypothetical protein